MNEMFKDWGFWKPIVKLVGLGLLYFGTLYFLPAKAALAVALIVLAGYFGFMLYWLGKSHYELNKSQMERNYKKLTGKDANEE